MGYFSRKSLSKHFMSTIDFSKHEIDIFINDTWQKYAGAIRIKGDYSKLQVDLNFGQLSYLCKFLIILIT
jgi:hypothetical protein